MNALTHSKSGYLPSGDGHLYVTCHRSGSADTKSVILLPPYAEERKSSYRLLFEMAERLVEAGWTAYRFDPRGVGESTGSHRDCTIEQWLADCAAVCNAIEKQSTLWLLGARFGANVALKAALTQTSVNGLVLWEPLISGESFVHDMIRRKQIKEMMGTGQADSGEDALEAAWAQGQCVDFDGFEMGHDLRSELAALKLVDDLKRIDDIPALVCHVGGARTLSGPWTEIAESLKSPSKAVCVRQKPFWGLLDYQECLELKDITQRFMEDMI